MDNQDNQSQASKDAKKEALKKGVAYDEMIRGNGWEALQEYIETRIKAFANEAINGFETMEVYQYNRGRVDGLRGLLGEVQGNIKLLEDEQKARRTTKE